MARLKIYIIRQTKKESYVGSLLMCLRTKSRSNRSDYISGGALGTRLVKYR